MLVEKRQGYYCISHSVKHGESMPQLASYYHIHVDLLVAINNIRISEKLIAKQIIVIPLTETNYFKTIGILDGQEGFKRLIYSPSEKEDLEIVSKHFQIPMQTLKKWNASSRLEKGIMIGWIKTETNMPKIQENQTTESQVLRTESNKVEFSVANPIPTQEKQNHKRTFKSWVYQILNGKEGINIPSTHANKQLVHNATALKKNITSTQSVTKEKDKITEKSIPENNEMKLVTELLTKGEIVEKVPAPRSNINRTENKKVAPEKEIIKPVVVQQDAVPVIDEKNKVASDHKDSVKKIDNDLLTTSSKLKLQSEKSGKCSFFYAPSQGIFYVFTNLANKGSVVKISNTQNGKWCMAEVIGTLPSSDVNKGLLLKLSDNAKLALGQKTNNFTVKVNY